MTPCCDGEQSRALNLWKQKGIDKGGNCKTSGRIANEAENSNTGTECLDYTVLRRPHHDLAAAPDSNGLGWLSTEALA